MKIRFTAPTAETPFFTNVKVQTKAGWRKVIANGPLGWAPALFPNEAEMIAGARRVAR
jgi:hypothetical protein